MRAVTAAADRVRLLYLYPSPTPRFAATSSLATRARPRRITTNCLCFVDEAQIDWCGFFAYSCEDGTYAATLDGTVEVPRHLDVGSFATVRVVNAMGPDLIATELVAVGV